MENEKIDTVVSGDYKLGFEVDIETDTVEAGLDEQTIAFISKKKRNLNGCWSYGSKPFIVGKR